MKDFVQGFVAVLAVGLGCSAEAQILMMQPDGRSCMHTGLSSDTKDCGTQSDWYRYVFVGTISAVTPKKDGEQELHIVPEEVFKGEPANPLTVATTQGWCFPEIKTGDHWLFYLRDEDPMILDFYGNISIPVADAQQQLETLRRLGTIGDNGILRGGVKQGPYAQGPAVPNASVIARRTTDNAQFVAATDLDGRYEFQPLPPGEYKLTVDSGKSFKADDGYIEVKSHQCWDVTLSRSPHARLSGHIRYSDGSPAQQIGVLIVSPDGSSFNTLTSDAHGYFYEESLSAGKYVVGINLPGARPFVSAGCSGACTVPTVSQYYPGMSNRADALAIDLKTDEKRDDIDFSIPVQK